MNAEHILMLFAFLIPLISADANGVFSTVLFRGAPMKSYSEFTEKSELPPVGHEVIIKGVPDISFCNTSLSALVVNSYSFQPEDIKSNENVTLNIFATLKEQVTDGKINVHAKVGPIPVANENLDLCKEVKAGGMTCPLAPMDYHIQQVLPIPKIPIHGSVSAEIKMSDQKDQELLCMDVKVHI